MKIIRDRRANRRISTSFLQMLVKFTWKTAGRWFESITPDHRELAQLVRAAVKNNFTSFVARFMSLSLNRGVPGGGLQIRRLPGSTPGRRLHRFLTSLLFGVNMQNILMTHNADTELRINASLYQINKERGHFLDNTI